MRNFSVKISVSALLYIVVKDAYLLYTSMNDWNYVIISGFISEMLIGPIIWEHKAFTSP